MTTYVVMGKDKFEASTPTEFLQKMHKAAHVPAPSDQEFMADVARRCKLQTGDTISSDTPENFLADLIAAKLVYAEGED